MVVDEASCIGCVACAALAPNTFAIETRLGRARVLDQWADSADVVLDAVDACPVTCIHRVPREQCVPPSSSHSPSLSHPSLGPPAAYSAILPVKPTDVHRLPHPTMMPGTGEMMRAEISGDDAGEKCFAAEKCSSRRRFISPSRTPSDLPTTSPRALMQTAGAGARGPQARRGGTGRGSLQRSRGVRQDPRAPRECAAVHDDALRCRRPVSPYRRRRCVRPAERSGYEKSGPGKKSGGWWRRPPLAVVPSSLDLRR